MAMRKYRRIGTYRSGQVKKSKKVLLIRIAFVIACALVLTFLSVLLGTHLQRKAEHASSMTADSSDTTVVTESIHDLFPDGIKVEDTEAQKLEVCAADIDITADSAESLIEKINTLSDKYNAISIRVNSHDGKLVYLSSALMEYTGLDPSLIEKSDATSKDDDEDEKVETYDVFENLKAALSAANHSGLRACVYFRTDPSVLAQSTSAASKCEIDSIIISELTSLGVDEVLIEGLITEEGLISNDTLRSVIRYLAVLREKCGDLHIGINLPDAVYLIPQNASIIKTLSEYTDFLAISISTDLTNADEAYSAVYDNFYSLKGNFSVYNLRGVIKSDIPEIAAAINASLATLSAKSTQFTVYVADPSYAPPSISVPETAETGVANENAKRSEDYETTSPSEE